ncbi:hypothetical protein BGZ95_011344 [Linnemannia exigua]|uniref:SWIM-type domain-containing protein n=1 Tax=Linnemannia exigua TaxID=604196 RepID=A0AAD4H5B8_9FUNG|nr:hypothetical protein BGZ95_011344 [Linnemannia exigua]
MRDTAAATPIGALDALLHSISTAGDLTDNHILTLMHIVGQRGNVTTTSVLGALRILDNPGSVQKLVARGTRRAVYQVKDPDSEIKLTCRPALRYCTCSQFFQVLVRESIMCEHVLAVKLTEALGTLDKTEISDESFADLP